jgi:hypothetical protein
MAQDVVGRRRWSPPARVSEWGTRRLAVVRFGMAIASLLLFIGLLELTAILGFVDYRLVVPRPEWVRNSMSPWEDPRNRPDPELIHIHRPYLRVTGSGPGNLAYPYGIPHARTYSFDVRHDQHGFRNDRDLERAAIAVIGDSFVEVPIVEAPSLLSSRLSRLLDVDVANLGQSSYGPQQELAVLRRFGLPLRPRVVLWLFFEGNDLSNLPRYERMVQESRDGGVRQPGPLDRSFTGNVVAALREYADPEPAPPEEVGRKNSCVLRPSSAGGAVTMYFPFFRAPTRDDLVALKQAQDMFLKARALSAEAGAHFLFVYVPDKYRVYRELCELPPAGFPTTAQLGEVPGRLRAWSETHAVPHLDLSPALQAAARRGEVVYFTDDSHWNEEGNRIAADEVARVIEDRRWLID